VSERRKQAPVQPFVRRTVESRPLVAAREGSLRRYVIASAFLLAAPLACVESQSTPTPHLGGAVAPVDPTTSVTTTPTTAPTTTPSTPPPVIEPVVVPVQGGAMPVSTGCPNDHPTS
jgi:hypothetical protein